MAFNRYKAGPASGCRLIDGRDPERGAQFDHRGRLEPVDQPKKRFTGSRRNSIVAGNFAYRPSSAIPYLRGGAQVIDFNNGFVFGKQLAQAFHPFKNIISPSVFDHSLSQFRQKGRLQVIDSFRASIIRQPLHGIIKEKSNLPHTSTVLTLIQPLVCCQIIHDPCRGALPFVQVLLHFGGSIPVIIFIHQMLESLPQCFTR